GALDPLWSLAVEQHFYLLWPIVIFFIPRRWVIRILLATLVLVPVLRAVCTPLFSSPDAIYSLTPFRIDAIAVGALAAFLLPHVHRPTAIRWAKAAMVSGMALYVVGNHFSAFHRQANTAVFNGLGYSLNLLVLGGLFVWVSLDEGSMLARLLSLSWLRGLGRISYCFYLFHFGVLCLLRDRMPRVEAALATFAITTVLATASWYCVERPILRLGRGDRRPKAPVDASFSTAQHLSLGAD
ncbi:MAG: acyltransferase, partial [Bryocella sp.]